MAIREAAVAGQFYTRDPARLRAEIHRLLEGAAPSGSAPKALIVPHAGHVYSGPTAAAAYRRLLPARARIRRVVLLGPAHYVPIPGLALPDASAFRTPLGLVPLDPDAAGALRDLPFVHVSAAAHAPEHCLEVQLPFLQVLLPSFTLVPLLVGEASPTQVQTVLERLWGGPETLILLSSDLSHYHSDAEARIRDAATCADILARRSLEDDQACGCRPLNGFLRLARERGLELELLDYRTSGDTAGGRDSVVGYGAFAGYEPN